MAANLMDALKGYFSDEMVGKLASQIGESKESTHKAISAAIPTTLLGLIQQTSTPKGTGDVVDIMKGQDWGKVLDGMGGMLGQGPLPEPAPSPGTGSLGGIMGMGGSILKMLFGGKLQSILSLLGMVSGLKSGALSGLLGLLAPLILGNIGKVLGGSGGISAQGLTSLLSSNKDAILKAAPAGLAGAMGLASLDDLGKSATGAVKTATDAAKSYTAPKVAPAPQASGLPGWLLPLLGLLALGAIAWALLGRSKEEAPVDDAVVRDQPAVIEPAVPVGDMVEDTTRNVVDATAAAVSKMELPGGISIDLPEGSPLTGVVDYLKTAEVGAEPKSFGLTGLEFEGETASVAPSTGSMLTNLVAILKAFTGTKAKLVAHAGSDTPEAAQLATDRVNALQAQLMRMGLTEETLTGVEAAGPTEGQPSSWIELLLSK